MAALDVLPLIKLPSSWPVPVVATLAMAALAGLDLLGAIAAKEWAERQNVTAIALGVLVTAAESFVADHRPGALSTLWSSTVTPAVGLTASV